MYSATLLDHFEHPRNAGTLASATAHVRVENPVCADVLELAIRVERGVIAEVRFLAKGCVPAMACGSLVTTLLEGLSLQEAAEITCERLQSEIGGLPEASSHAAQLAIDACRQVLRAAKAELRVAQHG